MFQVENGGAVFGVDIFGFEDIDLALSEILRGTAKDDILADKSESGLDLRLVREVDKGHPIGTGEECNVGVGRARRGRNNTGKVWDLGRNAVGDENVSAQKGPGAKGFIDLCSRNEDQASKSPTG